MRTPFLSTPANSRCLRTFCICDTDPFTIFGATQNIEDIIWPGVPPQNKLFVEPKRIVIRVVCVAFTATIAATVPDFSFLVGLTGESMCR